MFWRTNQYILPLYNWNIVESGVKTHNPNQSINTILSILFNKLFGDNLFAHIPDRRLHDCTIAHLYFSVMFAHTTFPIYTLYTCIIYYFCTQLKFYTSSEQYFLHLYLYDLYRTSKYYLIDIIHSEIIWFGNMEIFATNRGKPGLLYDGFHYRIHREAK